MFGTRFVSSSRSISGRPRCHRRHGLPVMGPEAAPCIIMATSYRTRAAWRSATPVPTNRALPVWAIRIRSPIPRVTRDNGAGKPKSTVRWPGNARELLLGHQQDRGIPTAKRWLAGCFRMCAMAGTGLGTGSTRVEGGFFPVARDARRPPLHTRATKGGGCDDVQDRARLGWGAGDHPLIGP